MGSRHSKFELAWRRRFSSQLDVDFRAFHLTVDPRDRGGIAYATKRYEAHLADLHCPIQRQIAEHLAPVHYIDVGANYGFTTLVHHTLNPTARITAVEPTPRLQRYLKTNLAPIPAERCRIVQAVCGETDSDRTAFFFSPKTSQDNRVISGGAGWEQTHVPSVSLATLLADATADQMVFIKSDTQGWEKQVLAGAAPFISRSDRWMIRMEYAAHWLASQGTEPASFLASLAAKWRVFPLPHDPRFRDSLARLADEALQPDECEAFTRFVTGENGMGHCDVLICPASLDLSRP